MTEDSAEKEHEPSARKLEEARRKGEIPRSADLTTAASYAGLLLAGLAFGPALLLAFGSSAMVFLDQPERMAGRFLGGGGGLGGAVLAGTGGAVLPLFLLPAVAALAVLLAQRGLVFAPGKLAPKLERISPIAGAKNKFGRKGLFEFAKSLGKLVITSILLWLFLRGRAQEILTTLHLAPGPAAALMMRLILDFLLLIFLLALVIGLVDLFWQRAEHLRQHRMTRKEMLDEQKSSEGDPHMKARRRQRGQDIATNRMLDDVAKADVVIVNPTHFAIALKWDRDSRRAPVCLAKGVDEIAARIRERAALAGVPLHHDPATARALHATIAIGDEIHPDHYRAVAAAIRFAMRMRKGARGRA
ncbi:EscU/YscU/HrcU family type III secretion system export apparatus switch protein [Szabonella alba]|uniref:Flagellar biosynthesis protein FlhB n=1 Tax=Szabonella alba TaxID=2804194 RepID=A0A8K0VB80_9RHOB|nr:flagellar type III secretion system protein FlhB [Szabonella alba]MBL4917023.1 flagellar biosynthesis protein FlhB [Szabonella alba]